MEETVTNEKNKKKLKKSQSVQQQPLVIGALCIHYKHLTTINYKPFVVFLWVTPLLLPHSKEVHVSGHHKPGKAVKVVGLY